MLDMSRATSGDCFGKIGELMTQCKNLDCFMAYILLVVCVNHSLAHALSRIMSLTN